MRHAAALVLTCAILWSETIAINAPGRLGPLQQEVRYSVCYDAGSVEVLVEERLFESYHDGRRMAELEVSGWSEVAVRRFRGESIDLKSARGGYGQ